MDQFTYKSLYSSGIDIKIYPLLKISNKLIKVAEDQGFTKIVFEKQE